MIVALQLLRERSDRRESAGADAKRADAEHSLPHSEASADQSGAGSVTQTT